MPAFGIACVPAAGWHAADVVRADCLCRRTTIASFTARRTRLSPPANTGRCDLRRRSIA